MIWKALRDGAREWRAEVRDGGPIDVVLGVLITIMALGVAVMVVGAVVVLAITGWPWWTLAIAACWVVIRWVIRWLLRDAGDREDA